MNEESAESPVLCEKKSCQTAKRVLSLLSEKLSGGGKRVAIFCHPYPDPDALSSMMGMTWLLQKLFEAEVDGFYDGNVSHPQNMALMNLLDPGLCLLEEYRGDKYDFRICVDTVPAHAAVGDHNVEFDLVVDHHKEIPNGGFRGTFFNLRAGSCAGTVYHLIKEVKATFDDDNDRDTKVATALMVGISTDTENMLSDDTTEYEFEAYWKLFQYRDPDALKKIVNYKRPKSWIDAKAEAASNAIISDSGVAVVGLGFVNAKQRDVIADVADEMVTWNNVETAVAFAVIEGDRIEGSVRSTNASLSVPQVCKELGGKCGSGGGKLGKGAYRYSLGGVATDEEDEDDTKVKMWEFLKSKEIKRILRTIR